MLSNTGQWSRSQEGWEGHESWPSPVSLHWAQFVPLMMWTGQNSANLQPHVLPPVTCTKAWTLLVQPPGWNSCVYLFVIYKIAPLASCWLWGASTQLRPASKSHEDQYSNHQPLSAGADLMIPPWLHSNQGRALHKNGDPSEPPKGGRSGFLLWRLTNPLTAILCSLSSWDLILDSQEKFHSWEVWENLSKPSLIQTLLCLAQGGTWGKWTLLSPFIDLVSSL